MKVGSLVECVDSLDNPLEYSGSFLRTYNKVKEAGYVFPKKGETYTVREISDEDPTCLGIKLEEIVNPIVRGFEVGFDIKCFREVQPPMDLTELLEETKELQLVIK